MEIRYNFYWNEHEQYASDKTGGVSLVSDGSLTLPTRNTGAMIHVYGWYDAAETAVSGPTTRTYDYRDVFATAGYDFSQYWTHATLTLPTGNTIRFPFYQVEIGTDNVVELCGSG